MPVHHALIPAMRYEDAPGAIDFLCTAFGFERQAVYADEADPTLIHHAQLTLNGNMIMLGSARPNETNAVYGWTTPAEAGGVTMSVYVVIDDPDAHHQAAAACGADVIRVPHDNEGYPGRAYEVRDSGGHVWSFGSYDPWATA